MNFRRPSAKQVLVQISLFTQMSPVQSHSESQRQAAQPAVHFLKFGHLERDDIVAEAFELFLQFWKSGAAIESKRRRSMVATRRMRVSRDKRFWSKQAFYQVMMMVTAFRVAVIAH